jgi:hypothetical protein
MFISSSHAERLPPREAIFACEGKAMGAPCEFKDRQGFARGICNDRPGIMACAPDRGRQESNRERRQQPNVVERSNEPQYSLKNNGSNKFKLETWADNWFAAYLGNQLIVEDSVSITTERSFNAETAVFEADYPLQINFILKDFKQNDTGLEYIGRRNQQMGDGGFIMQLTDMSSGDVVAVSDETLKCTVVHKAPLNKSCARSSSPVAGTAPCDFISLKQPSGWKMPDFDDSGWKSASVHSIESVRPKEGYNTINWSANARFIWGQDLETDNTILCRLTVDKGKGHSEASTSKSTQTSDIHSVFNYFNSNNVSISESRDYYYISADGIPAGELMVGIKSWQQQVPLPQNYIGVNAWPLTKHPEPAITPLSLSNNFYMGAVGIAADGTPIFNPLNNRGDDAYLVGELDRIGGHAGRADDYHYHIAPTHLNKVVGMNKPIAFMLDGYPLYGFTEPNGNKVNYSSLDKNKGHAHDDLGYHYHASKKYPYVNQNMYGKVTIAQDRRGTTNFITPQAKTTPIRESLQPLRGAVITGFTADKTKTRFSLSYKIKNKKYTLYYSLKNSVWTFKYPNHDGTSRIETYNAVSSTGNPNQNRYVHSHKH